jgi:hypothetical protein
VNICKVLRLEAGSRLPATMRAIRALESVQNMSSVPTTRSYAARLASVLVLAAAGCGDGPTGPVRPPEQSCPSVSVPLCEDSESSDVAREAVADLVGRVAPKLENPASREALVNGLGQLAIEAGLGNITAARRALAFSREALGAAMAQRSTYPGDAPDLGAIELELDRMATLLGTG